LTQRTSQFNSYVLNGANEILQRFVWISNANKIPDEIKLKSQSPVVDMQSASFDTYTCTQRNACELHDLVPVYASVLHFLSLLCTETGNKIFLNEVKAYQSCQEFIKSQIQNQSLSSSWTIRVEDKELHCRSGAHSYEFKRMFLREDNFYQSRDYRKCSKGLKTHPYIII